MKALIVVDAQYDFMPATDEEYENQLGGALAVKNGDEIIPVINKLLPEFDLIIFTKDWHLPDNVGFASAHEGKKPFDTLENGETVWPDHCVKNTRGAEIHKDIDFSLCKKDFYIFKKGEKTHPYSAFGDEFPNSELADFLDERGVHEVFIVGLATDFCVKDTAIHSSLYGYNTRVILDGCRAISDNIRPTIQLFLDNNIKLIESWELNMFNILQK